MTLPAPFAETGIGLTVWLIDPRKGRARHLLAAASIVAATLYLYGTLIDRAAV
jgi:hypothetical protein